MTISFYFYIKLKLLLTKYIKYVKLLLMRSNTICLSFSIVLLFSFINCTSTEQIEESITEYPVQNDDDNQTAPLLETNEKSDLHPITVNSKNQEPFSVSKQVFSQTFDNIENIIIELNKIINSQDYNTWLTYLTENYIALYSSPDKLKEISNQALLKKYNIKLRSLKDYFNYVVVPSRSNAKLDDILFLDNSHIKAITIINKQRTILYLLENIKGKWKIGI